MSLQVDLAALLCSRVCHDLISPVSALNNGLEVLEDDDDPEMREHALKLIGLSGRQAASKLKMARLAFGASTASGADIDIGEAVEVLREYFEGGKVEFTVGDMAGSLPKAFAKVVINLVLLGNDCVPFGGTIECHVDGTRNGGTVSGRVVAAGQGARLTDEIARAMQGDVDLQSLDTRLVQAYYTRLIAQEGGLHLSAKQESDRVTLSVQ